MSIDLFGEDIIHPTAPPAPYLGGKRQLAKTLVPMIDSDRHKVYVEPFVGMGGVFFRRQVRPPNGEVINDIDGEVTNLFRILQRHYVPFMEMMRFQITTRAGFDRLKKTDPTHLTDLERAARYIYLQRMAFGGKVTDIHFGVTPENPRTFDITKLAPQLEALHDRLKGVVVERLDWAVLIEKYDRKGTLFYLDPPYFGGENDYGKGKFDRDQFAKIADVLRSLTGKFILSINDTPEIREIFDGLTYQEVSLAYTISKTKTVDAKELIYTG